MNCIEELKKKIITYFGRFLFDVLTVRRRRHQNCRHSLPLAVALARRSLPVFREQRDCNIAILYPQLVNDAQPRRTAVHAEALLATD